MRTIAKIGCAVALATLGGCALQPIDPSKPASVGSITVDPQLAWASIKAGPVPVWTVDGLGLDELRFFSDIESGQPLMRSDRNTLPKYDATMLPDDVAELFAGTLGQAGFHQVQTSGLNPRPFGAEQGFSFNLSFTTPDGLEMKGEVLATQQAKELDAILFIAPGEYYFDRYAGTVDKVFASARRSR